MSARESEDFETKAHFTFIWIIENFSINFSPVKSPTFKVQSMEETKWHLKMYNYSDSKTLDLRIYREEDSGPEGIELEIEVSILTSGGLPSAVQTKQSAFKKRDYFSLELGLDRDDLIDRKRTEFLPYDKFTIRCRMWRTRTEIFTTETCFSHFRLGMDEYSCNWNIAYFSKLQPGEIRTRCLNTTSNRSPQLLLSFFLSESCGKYYANLQIDQNHATRNFYMSSKLKLRSIYSGISQSEEIHNVIFANQQRVYTFKAFIARENMIFPYFDFLTVYCKFEIDTEPLWNRRSSCIYLDSESVTTEILKMHLGVPDESCTVWCPFMKTLETMYVDESMSDVSLRAGGMSFPAHKSVLGARSPVFKVMFTHDMREKTSKIVNIPDFNADTVGRLLLYIYKNTVENLEWEGAADLFRAADKYELLDLRKRCSAILTANISVSSVCTVLSLAHMHEDRNLLKAAEDFISRHDNEVFDSDEWKTFKEENYRLALEVMERIIRLGKQKNN